MRGAVEVERLSLSEGDLWGELGGRNPLLRNLEGM
jgi:hypothetical protein